MQQLSQYTRAANVIILLAEGGFFSAVSPESKGVVRSVMESMFWVDNYVDSLDEGKQKQVIKNILGYLGGKEDLAIEDALGVRKSLAELKGTLDNSPNETSIEFLNKVVEVFESSKKLSSTTSPQEFIREREKEAVASADMFLVLAPQLSANRQFAGFFREISITGNLVDSIDDANEDKASGKIAIKPIKLYFSLAQKALTHATKAVKMHPHKLEVLHLGLGWLGRHVGLFSAPRLGSDEDMEQRARRQLKRVQRRSRRLVS